MPPRITRASTSAIPQASAATTTPSKRPASATTGPFHPPSDTATYKDLLLFEERLKMNARMLKRRKRRYEAFLVVLIGAIFFLANRILIAPPSLPLARYLLQGLLAVALVTLALFFASGMYQERIGYANKYVPHANRSLRSLNMHLNMRRPPRTLRSMFSWLPYVSAPVPIRRTPSPTPGSTTSSGTTTPPSSTIGTAAPVPLIPPIPPTTNPRGELIFSSRVDKTFKEGYERYRAAFERRRAEKMRERRGEAPLWKFLAVVGVWKVAVPVVSHGAGGNGNGGVAGQRQGGRPLQVGRRAPGSASPSPNRHAAGVQATA